MNPKSQNSTSKCKTKCPLTWSRMFTHPVQMWRLYFYNCLQIRSLSIGFLWQPTPVLLPGKSHGRRSLVGYSPWGRKELDTTERLHFHFSLSCTEEGNGNPLHILAWRIPGMGAWWAAVYGSHRVGHDWSDLAAAAAAAAEYKHTSLLSVLFSSLMRTHLRDLPTCLYLK